MIPSANRNQHPQSLSLEQRKKKKLHICIDEYRGWAKMVTYCFAAPLEQAERYAMVLLCSNSQFFLRKSQDAYDECNS
jgi:hypothetical protein